MSDELFSAVTARRAKPLPTFVPRCGHCGLYKRCESPKMRVDGEGRRGILIVGEWPGRTEDAEGRPFVGGSGRFLARELQKFGVDMRRDCWLTNALVCAPKGEVPAGAIDDCRPNLLKAIRDLNPTSIFLMGGAAIQAAVGHFWKPDVGPVGRWTGRRIPNHNPNAWVCPFNNPAHLLRDGAHPVELLQFRDSLGAAAALEGRPWADGPPDYRSKVEVILSPADAAVALKAIQSGVIAFDLETTTLKPDSAESRIVCCSVCHEGRRTIAFPWQGPAVAEMAGILRSPEISKIGYNLKFELRWIMAKLGFPVANWLWDGMLAAHALDARRGRGDDRAGQTTGLKFQSYCLLGAPDYSGHLDDFLRPAKDDAGGNDPNEIRRIDMRELLIYCGIDSLLEWEVAQIQMREIGRPVGGRRWPA